MYRSGKELKVQTHKRHAIESPAVMKEKYTNLFTRRINKRRLTSKQNSIPFKPSFAQTTENLRTKKESILSVFPNA
jgi:hypothetical protein